MVSRSVRPEIFFVWHKKKYGPWTPRDRLAARRLTPCRRDRLDGQHCTERTKASFGRFLSSFGEPGPGRASGTRNRPKATAWNVPGMHGLVASFGGCPPTRCWRRRWSEGRRFRCSRSPRSWRRPRGAQRTCYARPGRQGTCATVGLASKRISVHLHPTQAQSASSCRSPATSTGARAGICAAFGRFLR